MSATPATDLTTSIHVPKIVSIRSLTYVAIIAADLVAFSASWLISTFIRFELAERFGPVSYVEFLPSLAIFGFVFVLVGLYPGIALNPIEELRRILRSASLGFLTIIGLTFFLHEGQRVSQLLFLAGWVLTLCSIFLGRHIVRSWCSHRSWWGIPTVIIGERESARSTLALIKLHRPLGLRPVAILYDADSEREEHLRTLESEHGLFSGRLSQSLRISVEYPGSYAILSMPMDGSTGFGTLLQDHASHFRRVLVLPEMFGVTSLLVTAKDVCGVLALEVNQQLTRLAPQIIKRMFDLTLCISVGLLLSPAMLLIYVLTRLSSPGPAFFGHSRIGRGGRRITVWKFRSMVLNAEKTLEEHLARDPALRAEWEVFHKLRKDPRITVIGRFLRKTSLDELPQLWNVIRGDMSLIGPRPIVKSEIVKYGAHYRQYCRVAPGITGLWQISGRNNTTYELRTQLDEYYVRNWSIAVDLYILLYTLKTVLFAEGAY